MICLCVRRINNFVSVFSISFSVYLFYFYLIEMVFNSTKREQLARNVATNQLERRFSKHQHHDIKQKKIQNVFVVRLKLDNDILIKVHANIQLQYMNLIGPLHQLVDRLVFTLDFCHHANIVMSNNKSKTEVEPPTFIRLLHNIA